MSPLPAQECCCPAVTHRRIRRRGTHITVILYPGVLSGGGGGGGFCFLFNW